jgi:hypothetical protein
MHRFPQVASSKEDFWTKLCIHLSFIQCVIHVLPTVLSLISLCNIVKVIAMICLVCSLFNDAVSSSDYIALDDRMINK